MSQNTRKEVLKRMRQRYAKAGPEYKSRLITEMVELFGYHRKAAIRALRPKPEAVGPYVIGRPREYDPEKLLVPLKVIWLAALQPCGKRLVAALPDWLRAYEQDHRRISEDDRQQLVGASAATLDRLLRPLRVEYRRRGATRSGNLLRQEIPIRTEWLENVPGYLEMDTVALCGGRLDDRHVWMFDSVDIQTTWIEMRALPNRGQAVTIEQLKDVEKRLPFELKGIDSDNGGEFINHHMVEYAHGRSKPLAFTRARAYRKNDNAHVEQKNYTHVRQWFGYERHDNPAVVPLMNELCRGALGQLTNWFLPNMKLESKRREGSKTKRVYGPAMTALARVLASETVSKETKERLKRDCNAANPFDLRRQIDRRLKEINEHRLLKA